MQHRKTRTHVKQENAKFTTPKSFVVAAGALGSSGKMLTRDIRAVLEPHTATRLKERKSNKMKDFVAMTGPLGVSHLLSLSQSGNDDSRNHVNLRISKLQRGPTLTFRILRYSLARDVLNSSRRPHSPDADLDPQLILNGFTSQANNQNVKLMTTLFQNLFPSIKVQSMSLSQARRIVLLSYDPITQTIDFRHYLINIRPVGVSKAIRKIVEGSNRPRLARASSIASSLHSAMSSKPLPDLGSTQDISDYILSQGSLSFATAPSDAESELSDMDASDIGSEIEDTSGNGVHLGQDYVGRGNKRAEQRAIRLIELGPRMQLGLVKVEDGIDGKGEVLFHEFIKKSSKEAAAISKTIKAREAIRKQRREEQMANVERKRNENVKRKATITQGETEIDVMGTESPEDGVSVISDASESQGPEQGAASLTIPESSNSVPKYKLRL